MNAKPKSDEGGFLVKLWLKKPTRRRVTMEKQKSRRDFIKTIGVAGVGGVAALAGLGSKEAKAQGPSVSWDREVDAVLVGYGGAGAAVAITDMMPEPKCSLWRRRNVLEVPHIFPVAFLSVHAMLWELLTT